MTIVPVYLCHKCWRVIPCTSERAIERTYVVCDDCWKRQAEAWARRWAEDDE